MSTRATFYILLACAIGGILMGLCGCGRPGDPPIKPVYATTPSQTVTCGPNEVWVSNTFGGTCEYRPQPPMPWGNNGH